MLPVPRKPFAITQQGKSVRDGRSSVFMEEASDDKEVRKLNDTIRKQYVTIAEHY